MTINVHSSRTSISHQAEASIDPRRVSGLRYVDRGNEVEVHGVGAYWVHDPNEPTTWRLERAHVRFRRIKKNGEPYALPGSSDMISIHEIETFRAELTAMWPTVRITAHEGS